MPPLGGGKGTGFVGSPWATENPVTRFPPGKVVASATKGGEPPEVANHRNAASAYESRASCRTQPAAGMYCRLSHMHHVPRFFASLRMTVSGGKSRNVCRRQAAIKFIARRAIPSPLNPLNLLNPLNPHARKGVSKSDTFPSAQRAVAP